MKPKFNKNYFIAFILLFLTEAGIAHYLKTGFIRHTVGDFLVVMLIYCFLRSFLKANALAVGMATLCVAYLVEFLQLSPFLETLGLEHNRWAHLVFGNSFSVQDLVAYTLGVVSACGIDLIFEAGKK